ncbi:radical SAM protein [Porphyromonas macacae]|uniref:TIGR01212 family radical SAM protein n=1 Tax=Porphyromonas macacae TaxID=28115 RepID=UPI00052DE3F1|nr:TIGR01212 family radical SAM protein [Porphyromonas macacae]KGN97200.1 radical SAM protein [Porphyromonas macacae]
MTEWIEFSEFLKRYFPEGKMQKISINAGFSCPTRDGSLSRGGCTYCNNRSFSPSYAMAADPVHEQLRRGIAFFSRKYVDMRYLAYFQSYTSTYGEVEQIWAQYMEALNYPGVVGLIIGTRPDCMPEELLRRLSKLSERFFVMIEYGVESTIGRTLERVRRGHDWACSAEAICKTHDAGILVGAHLIMGLPGETEEELLSHADRLNELPLDTLKLHQLQIIKGTIMAQEYRLHPERFRLFSESEYIDLCVRFALRLRDGIVLERFVSQSPPELVLAPQWGLKNYEFANRLRHRLCAAGIRVKS